MANEQQPATSTAVANVIKKNLELAKPTFDQLNLNGLNFFKELEYATQILSANTYLAGANPETIRNALVNVAMSGLTLSPVLKLAYLIPRQIKINNQKILGCLLEPSYMGLCKILTDTGSVIGISATIVYTNEAHTLAIKQGMNGHASHVPYIGKDKPGEPIACYSIAVLPNGMQHVELLRPWEWEDIEKRSESVKTYTTKKANGEYAAVPTWLTDREEMIRKTCLKKHYKYLPKTEHAEKVAQVIDLDNQANGIEFENQNQQANQSPAAATPDAPAQEALATDEDALQLKDLLEHAAMPDEVMGVNKAKLLNIIGTKYKKGEFTKSKAEEYIDKLTAILDEAIEKNMQDVGEETPSP